ncbi:MAG: hypothetical protein C9356_10230 [Oleiphilus sp.]|nr:MAG: hypothetical protein C9356_10230 [Oleiphilus sp.]
MRKAVYVRSGGNVFAALYLLILLSLHSVTAQSSVVLQYHHISDSTPHDTSVTPEQFIQHLDWLDDQGFRVLPLQVVVETIRKGKPFAQDNVVAISFDDAGSSVCDTAWPILKKRQLPFTVFINTEPVEKGYRSQCSWEALKGMAESGLMTVANHSHRHLHMISTNTSHASNLNLLREEIIIAQDLLKLRLGKASQLFAYPYGEYNRALTQLVTELGYTGFGQHSGAIGQYSDFSALPRFPASGQHANLDTLSVKLLSRPLPVRVEPQTDNPVHISGNNNPPTLHLNLLEPISHALNCFDASGQAIKTTQKDSFIEVVSPKKFGLGRHRYTCTARSDMPGRFYWLSHQWLVE